jgi:hypothetical protein
VIVLRGTLGSGAKPVALDFKFGVYATPQPILEVIPGALGTCGIGVWAVHWGH